MVAKLMNSEEKYSKKVLADAKRTGERMGVDIKTEMIVGGSVANTIAEFAREGGYDLIAMGTRGRSGVKRVLLGSVAFGVVTYAPCTVVVVR